MPEIVREKVTLETALNEWWHDTRPDSNWRLSWSGFVDLADTLDIESWEFEFKKKDISPYMLLKLSRNMTTPYYIVDNRKQTKLYVLDSKVAVMISLYGNVESWIENLR